MDESVRQLVRDRAEHRCEYCRLLQRHLPFSTFQIELIRPKKHGGNDDPVNLALACERCNSHKGPNLTGIDPQTQQIVQLFDPRQNRWADHFESSPSRTFAARLGLKFEALLPFEQTS